MSKHPKQIIETLNFFDLIETKNSPLFNFFAKELKELLKKNFTKHLFDNGNILHFYSNEFFLKYPKNKKLNKDEESIYLSLFIPTELLIKQTNKIIQYNTFICNLPILLNNSYYWINGIPKIINQQLAFDPVLLIDNKEKTQAFLYDQNQESQIRFSVDIHKQPRIHIGKKTKLINTYQKNKLTTKTTIKTQLNHLLQDVKLTNKARYTLNEKFNLTFPLNLTKLTDLDINKIINYLLDIVNKNKKTDELDDLGNKAIKDIKDYYRNIISNNIHEIESLITNKKSSVESLIDNIQDNQTSNILDELFSNSDISLPIDQINNLSELSQQRKILNLKKQEGNKNISIDIRNIHPSIFGRLCVIETPEGESAGLINSFTTLSLINKFGLIETPLNFTKNHIEFINTKVKYFADNNENLKGVGFSTNLEKFKTTKQKRPLKINKDIEEKNSQLISKTFISYLQIFSIACSNIPFLEHNDGNRILMGATMQRQAVPLIYAQTPIVASGLEDILAHSSTTVKSLTDGVIIYSDATKIITQTQTKQRLIYYLDKIKTTFNETVNNSSLNLWPGEKIYFGQILANGFSILNSEISLGTNLTIAYMNWDGFNFEDAIVISDRLVKQDKLTSLHIKTLLIEVNENEEFYVLNSKTKISAEQTFNLNNFSLIKIGSSVQKGDVLFIKESKTLNVQSNKIETKLVFVETEFNGIIHNVEIQDPEVHIQSNNKIEIQNKTIKIDIMQIRKIQIGDKLSGRFGNKGVISRLVPEADMPFLTDGSPVDVLLNPLGIPSRMNIGQVFESLLGIVGSDIKKRFSILSFDEKFSKNASRVLLNEKLKETLVYSNNKLIHTNKINDKRFVIDGRSGEFFDNPVLVGRSYILKLYHLVEEKVTSRTQGPSSLITNQPLRGKKHHGGQRFGEMEVWALEAYGASYSLHEMLTLKSDDVLLGNTLLKTIENDLIFDLINYSKSLFILDLDLRALGFELTIDDFNLMNENIISTGSTELYKGKDLYNSARQQFIKLYG